MIAGSVVYRQLDLVGIVNGEFMNFVRPLVVPRSFRASLEGVFDLHDNKRLGAPAKASGSGMIHVGHLVNSQCQMTGERFPGARDVQAVICADILSPMLSHAERSNLPSGPSPPSISTWRSS